MCECAPVSVQGLPGDTVTLAEGGRELSGSRDRVIMSCRSDLSHFGHYLTVLRILGKW